MTPTAAPTTRPYQEHVRAFGRNGTLVGILSEPTATTDRIPILILGAGIIHKIGPSRSIVELARALATAGHTTLRFDLSGIGDSARATETALEDAVVADIRDALTALLAQVGRPEGPVCLVGFCSGADNGLHVGADDPRVSSLVLFDPTIHRTRGFHRRQLIARLTSARSWWNVLSGRSLRLRLRGEADNMSRPPGYYGLLVHSPQETDRRAAAMVRRGARLHYILSGGLSYCNSPKQVAESLPNAYSPECFSVTWRGDMDHILSAAEQRRSFSELIVRWLDEIEGVDPTPLGSLGS